jgi:spermidine synthase
MTVVAIPKPETLVSRRALPVLVGVLFFLSGFSALSYQIAWQRMLGLFSGSDSIAVTIIVGSFLLGLGIGSLVASVIADRLSTRGAILGFALCEFGVGLFAIASKLFFYDLLFKRMVAFSDSAVFVFFASFLGLLVPTFLMGLSLPLLAKALVRQIETAAAQIGWLYGVNTLGACAGAFVSGCVIIGAIGYVPTIILAAGFNFLVALLSLLLALQRDDNGSASATASQATPQVPAMDQAEDGRLWVWCTLVFLSGFAVISLELIWFRSISAILASTAYSFALVLGCFLLGDAAGVLYGIRLLDRIKEPRRFFLYLQASLLCGAILLLWLTAFLLSWPEIYNPLRKAIYVFYDAYWGDDPLTPPYIALVLLVVGVIVIPPAFLAGLSVPVSQKAIQNDLPTVGRKVALIQVANIVGNAAGSFATGLLLLHWFGTPGTLRLLSALGLGFVLWAVFGTRKVSASASRGVAGFALAAALGAAVVGLPSIERYWDWMMPKQPGGRVVATEDRTGAAAFKYTSLGDGVLYLGGRPQSMLPFGSSHIFLGILGPLVHPNPKSTLIVGLGTGGTAYAAAANPSMERVRVAEINSGVYNVMNRFTDLGGKMGVGRPFRDAKFERYVGDARHFMFTTQEKFDVIEQDPISPHDSFSGLLYSVEYFQQVLSRLNPGGICVQWVPFPRIRNSFLAAFPYVVRIGTRMIGSNQPINFSPDGLEKRLHEQAILAALQEAGETPASMMQLVRDIERFGPTDPRPTDLDSDLFPKDEFYINHTKIDF